MNGQIKAVIDADFFRNATEHDNGVTLFLRILNGLDMQPVMHEFVAETELHQNKYLKQVMQTGQIVVIRYGDYLQNDAEKEEYKEYFLEAFERINRYDFPQNEDIYQYSHRQESLGEIRSFYMALKMGCPYFMSDDGDSKTLARNFSSSRHTVDVASLYDVLIMCKKKGVGLSWKDINPTVTKAMNKRQDKVSRLKELYRNE